MELDKSALKGDELKYFIPQEEAADAIGAADKLVIIGVTLLNDKLEEILSLKKERRRSYRRRAGRVYVLKALFDRGVSHAGVYTTHADELLDMIAQAGSGCHFFGKFAEKLVMSCKSSASKIWKINDQNA